MSVDFVFAAPGASPPGDAANFTFGAAATTGSLAATFAPVPVPTASGQLQSLLVPGSLNATFALVPAPTVSGQLQSLLVPGSLNATFALVPAPTVSGAGQYYVISVGALTATFAPVPAPAASGTAQYLALTVGRLDAGSGDLFATATGSVLYESRTARPSVGQAQARHQQAQPSEVGVQERHQVNTAAPAGVQTAFAAAQPTPAGVQHTSPGSIKATPVALHAPHQDATGAQAGAGFEQQGTTPVPLDLTAPHSNARPAQRPTGFAHQDTTRVPQQRRTRHQSARTAHRAASTRFQPARQSDVAWHSRFQDTRNPPPGLWVYVAPLPPKPPSCYDPVLPANLVFADPFGGVLPANLLFACAPGVGPEQPGATRIVPIRGVYIVINNITLHRVDTGAELHAHSFGMSLDYQSWTWSWQASLHADAAPHLGRDSQGDPAEVEAVVNGTPFRLRLVSIARDRRFSPTRWSVSGQGKAAILATPWAPKLSFGNPSAARTAQQLANDALTINGVGIGWAIDWGLADWQVPAGAWALQGSYIDAINDIAGAVGGYVQPHATASTLRILPRYPAPPWAWGSITPDFEIPEDAAEVEGTQYVDRPAYNRVFVGGIGAGVFGPFTRAGTAGNSVAPQATHALITDAPAHRQRGIAALSDTGRQEHITLNMQVMPETGVIVPGQFVRYLGPAPKLGIVRSTSIDWSRPKLRQSIRLETHA